MPERNALRRHRITQHQRIFDVVLAAALALWAPACGPKWQGSIGAMLGKDNRDGRVYLRQVPAGMGAERAGLSEGDEIVEIEGRPARDMSPNEVHAALQGEVGTKVNLKVARGGVTRAVQV